MSKIERIYLILVSALIFITVLAQINLYQQNHAETTKQIQQWQQEIEESRQFRQEMQRFMDKLRVEEFTTTAYSPLDDKSGRNSWRPKLASRGYMPRTRAGTIPRPGVVAVDPEVIPLGSRLWVEGYGFARAEDTGGLIKGRHIDLYKPTYKEAMNYGVRQAKVMWLVGD
jgi:3D (Asp-Asp-Asp) domain-containing protein